MELGEDKDNLTPKKQTKAWKVILFNIAAMVVIGLVLIWISMLLLKSYTRHNQAFRMPDVTGMTQEEAQRTLSKESLMMEVTDSIYSELMPAGVVLETTPKPGSMIKKKRTIYVIVNNSQVKQLSVPDVHEISRRQAEALLRGSGFINVTVKYIPGTFHDLALYLKNPNGRILTVGEKVPYNMALTLEVTSSDMMEEAIRDSLISEGVEESLIHNGPKDTPNQSNDNPDNSGEDWF
ncbi:PASTA domain-containing protein [Porphyromonadaceae bacterium W3.11]|nr:PASTA domain-containing protein [Porphyromonadaceae bacterium W3.11]